MITIRIDDKEQGLLTVAFPADPIGNYQIGQVPGRRWSYSRRCWVVPNTRESVIKIGKLFGKEHCRFDEAVVRLYKPTATLTEIEEAANPGLPPAGWPPTGLSPAGLPPTKRKLFRFQPPQREYDRHPVIVAVCNELVIRSYSYKTLKTTGRPLFRLLAMRVTHHWTSSAYRRTSNICWFWSDRNVTVLLPSTYTSMPGSFIRKKFCSARKLSIT